MPLTNLISIGRSEECDVTIASESLSHTHAMLLRSNNRSNLLIDCGSTNGTRLRATDGLIKVKQTVVSDNQRIILGDYECEVASLITQSQSNKDGRLEQNYTMMRDPQTGEVKYDKR